MSFSEAISEAFYQDARNYVAEHRLTPQNYSMQMKIHHNTGNSVWTGGPMIPLTDWMEDRERTRQWLDRLAKELNSAEDLDATAGEFYAS